MSLRLELGRKARALIEEKFDLEKNIEKILRYMKLASERRTFQHDETSERD